MADIFSNAKRPFFSSTHYLSLDKIDQVKYASFIKKMFQKSGKKIEDDAVQWILDWSKTHTFYTQSLCNMTFSLTEEVANIDLVKKACLILLRQGESVYLQYRQLLTPAQWNFLIAVAKEDFVRQITAQTFIARYEIGTPANARRLSKALIEKELILSVQDAQGIGYQVYDVFFSRWLQMEY